MGKMKAAVFYGSGKPLQVEDVEMPVPGAEEVLVKIAACGVCHTDLHYLDHGVPTFKKPPLILGHEPSGIVAEVGQKVKQWKVGDRVLLRTYLRNVSLLQDRQRKYLRKHGDVWQ
jgi:D-arabinose 1-dehydrogenase-like Zn-dependent alcohol dehydrogenase